MSEKEWLLMDRQDIVHRRYFMNQLSQDYTLKNQSTGSVIPKNWMCICCGELYREMTSNPSRKNPNALAKASWCFCGSTVAE